MGPISRSCGETDDTPSLTPSSLTQPPRVRLRVGDTFSHPGRGAGLQDCPPACSAGQHPATPSASKEGPFSFWAYLELITQFTGPRGLLQSLLGTRSLWGGALPAAPRWASTCHSPRPAEPQGYPVGVWAAGPGERVREMPAWQACHPRGLRSTAGPTRHSGCILPAPRGARAQAPGLGRQASPR